MSDIYAQQVQLNSAIRQAESATIKARSAAKRADLVTKKALSLIIKLEKVLRDVK